jgi:hypothetical protein
MSYSRRQRNQLQPHQHQAPPIHPAVLHEIARQLQEYKQQQVYHVPSAPQYGNAVDVRGRAERSTKKRRKKRGNALVTVASWFVMSLFPCAFGAPGLMFGMWGLGLIYVFTILGRSRD